MAKNMFFVFLAIYLTGCSITDQPAGNVVEDPLPVEPTVTNTVSVEPTETIPVPPLTFEIPDSELPLAEPGPYEVGMIMNIESYDESRDNRKVTYWILYPSINGEPDLHGAPFPMVINSGKMLATLGGEHLVSHGFVVVGITGIDYSDPWDEYIVNQPLDYLFTINQFADSPPELLEGVIDTDRVGVWGYSFGGNNSMFLSGARVDPEYYFNVCGNPEETNILSLPYEFKKLCSLYENWDYFANTAGSSITNSDDGLWQPVTDERILAVMPMSSESEILFGPRGLAYTNKPVLITSGSNEPPIFYESSFRAFQEFGSAEKTFISFVNQDHFMIFDSSAKKRMEHLGVAFFSHHLKGYDEYAYYYSEEFISQVEGLAWGWYEE